MSNARVDAMKIAHNAGGTDEHAKSPFVASYDVVDFLTTIAFVSANIAKTTSIALPMVSNILHLINYSLLGYIQAKGLDDLAKQENIDKVKAINGPIDPDETKAELLPPKKGKKSNAEYAWNLAMYILKMLACSLLITLSVISTAAVAGSIATFVNVALFPIAYVITTGINVLKFGKNLLKGVYDYFLKGSKTGDSAYKRHHATVDKFENELSSYTYTDVSKTKFKEYVAARKAINQAGRNNIQNSIFLGLSAGFFAASILFVLSSSILMTAALPPVGMTIGGAIFAGVGVIFAIQGITVLANAIRKKRGLAKKDTLFEKITKKFYPEVTEKSVTQQHKINVIDDPIQEAQVRQEAEVQPNESVEEETIKNFKAHKAYSHASLIRPGSFFKSERDQSIIDRVSKNDPVIRDEQYISRILGRNE